MRIEQARFNPNVEALKYPVFPCQVTRVFRCDGQGRGFGA
jgi:hypothetical protein